MDTECCRLFSSSDGHSDRSKVLKMTGTQFSFLYKAKDTPEEGYMPHGTLHRNTLPQRNRENKDSCHSRLTFLIDLQIQHFVRKIK
ncbi:hypothetical protein GDO78_012832 [Eleutherodactylus coqui]|uniref:Uncharacterized protein n=1 Tax=Eleutherodactylus coqui TaxID=57060 RepID=A0A8J6F2J2_ELECQ|nr:hypothetical protein GDO78_012832 [Eleutherodactylus coqui]